MLIVVLYLLSRYILHSTLVAVTQRLLWELLIVFILCGVALVSSDQCDQIGRFLKVLASKFDYKSSLNIDDFFGLFWKGVLYEKTAVAYTWTAFGNIWATFLLQYLVTLFQTFCLSLIVFNYILIVTNVVVMTDLVDESFGLWKFVTLPTPLSCAL